MLFHIKFLGFTANFITEKPLNLLLNPPQKLKLNVSH